MDKKLARIVLHFKNQIKFVFLYYQVETDAGSAEEQPVGYPLDLYSI
jgi:hypothetical protein